MFVSTVLIGYGYILEILEVSCVRITMSSQCGQKSAFSNILNRQIQKYTERKKKHIF